METTKQAQTPSRMTRSRKEITEQSPRKVTPSRVCKNKVQEFADPKGTQESTAQQAQPVRRKLQVRKAPTKNEVSGTSQISPTAEKSSSKRLTKLDPPHGNSSMTSEVRFSKAPQQSGGQKMFVDASNADYHIRPDAPSHYTQM